MPEKSSYNPEDPRRKIKVIKNGGLPVIKPLKIEFTEDPVEEEPERQRIDDWASELRAQVKLKEQDRLNKEGMARDEIKRIFGDKKD